MAVGKPNFNLNSFGIKYLSKDEVQELLNKAPPMDMRSSYERHRDNEKEQESGVSNIKDEDLTTAKLNTSLSRPSVNTGTGASISSGASAPRRARNAAQPAVQAVKPAVKPAEVKPKADKDTKSIFNAEQDPKTLSFDQRKLLEDANEARPKNPKPDIFTGITPEKRRDYPTQGVIANSANVRSGEEGGKTEDITEVPDPKKRGGHKDELNNLGRTIPKGYKAPKGEKAERKRLSSIKPDEKKEKEVKEKETRETKDIPKKMGSRMVGNAPPEVKDTTNQVHSGKKVTVGVGEKAKEVFDKKEGVGAVHEETSKPKTVVAKPDKELNSITSSENNRLGDHRNEMDKFLKGATDAQRREYLNIKEREDGREDHDAQRAYARNITGKQSKTQEKVTQTKEEKESERKLEHADRMVDMKERDKRIKQEAWKEDEEFHKKIEEDEKTWQGKPDGKKDDKKFYGTGEKEGKTSTRVTPTKEKPVTTEDNPQSSKAPEEETEPNKITTDNIDNKLNAIATKLAQIKDPKKREEKRAELSGKNESDKSKKEIAAAKKRVEAAKKKIAAAKTKKETAKKKKVIPKEGQLTPAQVKAYKKERESKKDVVAKSNDIIMDTIIMKLDLM